MANTNRYADAVFQDNPSAIWTFDDVISGVPQLLSGTPAIALPVYGIATDAYSESQNVSYYVSPTSSLSDIKVENSGLPMVYGATNISNLYENLVSTTNHPSLIVPGYGLFNENGRNKTMSIEFWARITSDTIYPRKIMGPISGADGLYVSGPFILLKINDYIGSHYVGEWGRPMLINVSYSPNFASVILNGEQVINLQYSYTDLVFPSNLDANSDKQDYIGFYAYSNVPLIQIDCVSIYPYSMQPETAKLHFVKGQSVQSPELTQTQYASLPVVIDYQVSKFANNYVYPGNGRWENGITENMAINQNVISAPDYVLPTMVFEDETKTVADWYDAQKDISYQRAFGEYGINNAVFFEINPNEANDQWASQGYMVFEDFSKILSTPVKAFYMVFSTNTLPTVNTEQVLFRLGNNSGEYLESVITTNTGDTSGTIIYRFYSGGVLSTIRQIDDIVPSTIISKTVVGIDINELITSQVSNDYILSFFSNAASLKLFVGGTAGFSKTFYGQIYRVGFCNDANLKPIKSRLFTNGIADVVDEPEFTQRFSSYTLFANNSLSSFTLDIAVAGSWKDYIPVSLLAKNVIANSLGNTEYTLDHIQVNFDYPEISNVSNSMVRSYVEFEEIGTSIVSSSQLTKTTNALSSTYVVDPGTDWLNKRYEIVDNSIIHLPSGGYDDLNDLSIAINFDYNIPGIIRNPIKMKSLQIASLALNYADMQTHIGTKYSQDIHPYTKTATVVGDLVSTTTSYDGVNPFTIYKNSTPYLYLTEKSGVKLVGSNIGELNTSTKIEKRGIAIPINESGKQVYSVSLFQMSVFYKNNFATSEIEVFRVSNFESEFLIDAVRQAGNKTATLRIRKLNDGKTDYESFSNAEFFVNGKSSSTIKVGVWNMVCVKFTKTLTFANNNNGLLKLTGPFVYNNIVDYQVNSSRLNKNVQLSKWSEIQSRGTWTQSYDVDEAAVTATWLDILISAEVGSPVSIDATSTYSSYLGNSKIVANDDSWFTYFDQNEFELYNGIRSETIRLKPL